MHGENIWGFWKLNGSRQVVGKRQNLKHHWTGYMFPFLFQYPSAWMQDSPEPQVEDRIQRIPPEAI